MNSEMRPIRLNDDDAGLRAGSASIFSNSAFIARWQGVTASELSTSQSFVIELCELLGVPRPHATAEQDYMFERPVTFAHGDGSTSAGRIDCYRRGAFIWESKKLKPGAAAAGANVLVNPLFDQLHAATGGANRTAA